MNLNAENVNRQNAEEYDMLIECELASIIAGERAKTMGLPPPDDFCDEFQAARYQPLLGREAIRQERLSLRDVGYGLASTVDMRGAAYLDKEALVIARAVTASSGTSPGGLLGVLPALSLTKGFIQERKGVAHNTEEKLLDTVET